MSDDALVRLDVAVQPSQIGSSWLQREQLATSMTRFPRHAASRSSWRGQHERVVVRLHTASGLTGTGATRGTGAAAVVRDHLGTLLRGRHASEHAELYDEMAAAQITYGGSGVAAAALSAVDLALWDLAAQMAAVPLSRLLAGDSPVRESVACYTTMHPETERDLTGYGGIKLAARFGPDDGDDAVLRMAQDLRQMRGRLPEGVLLMVDSACGWTPEFTLDLLDAVGAGVIDWLEDPILPWDRAGYERIAGRLAEGRGTSLCLGNYDFSLREGLTTLAEGFVDVYQPDVTWAGGITAARELCRRASAAAVDFSPHYGAMHPWTVHLMGSLPGDHLAEYIPASEEGTRSDYPDLTLPQQGVQTVPAGVGATSAVPDVVFARGDVCDLQA